MGDGPLEDDAVSDPKAHVGEQAVGTEGKTSLQDEFDADKIGGWLPEQSGPQVEPRASRPADVAHGQAKPIFPP